MNTSSKETNNELDFNIQFTFDDLMKLEPNTLNKLRIIKYSKQLTNVQNTVNNILKEDKTASYCIWPDGSFRIYPN